MNHIGKRRISNLEKIKKDLKSSGQNVTNLKMFDLINQNKSQER